MSERKELHSPSNNEFKTNTLKPEAFTNFRDFLVCNVSNKASEQTNEKVEAIEPIVVDIPKRK